MLPPPAARAARPVSARVSPLPVRPAWPGPASPQPASSRQPGRPASPWPPPERSASLALPPAWPTSRPWPSRQAVSPWPGTLSNDVEPLAAEQMLPGASPRFQQMPSCLTPLNLYPSHVAVRPTVRPARITNPACAPRSDSSAAGNSRGRRASSHRAPLVAPNIASQRRYVIGAATDHGPNPLAAVTLPVEANRYGVPGSGSNSFALPGLSFHSSASAGASPLRVMLGHSAA